MNTKIKLMTLAMTLAAFQAGADSSAFWANGVSSTNENWRDYNKIYDTTATDQESGEQGEFLEGEINLCWAASASNMLHWWQESNAHLAPVNLSPPDGADIWDTYKKVFTDKGFTQYEGIYWWMTGGYSPDTGTDDNDHSDIKDGYKDLYEKGFYGFTGNQVDSYLTNYDVSSHVNYLKSRLVGELKAGKAIGGGISDTTGTIAHAITIWGAEYDEASGKITKIWVTDSDDPDDPDVKPSDIVQRDKPSEPTDDNLEIRTPSLRGYNIVEKEIVTQEGYKITALVFTDYYCQGTIFLETFCALSKNAHAAIDTSVASLLSTHNGKRGYMLMENVLDSLPPAQEPENPTPDTDNPDNTYGGNTYGNNPPGTGEAEPDKRGEPNPELRKLEKIVNRLLATYDLAELDRLSAAVSGSSIPALGKAFSDDMNRQLRTMRDRATQTAHSFAPNKNYHVWVEADGNTARLSSKDGGALAGYDLHSWGGTVGVTAKATSEINAGLAFTSLCGNFNANSIDRATGDLDTYYLTTFASANFGNWEHSFVATLGRANSALNREVRYDDYLSQSRGKSDGTGFGFMYETAYNIKMQDSSMIISPVFNVSVTHSRMHGFTEQGNALTLSPGVMDMQLWTIGTGARMQTEFGENLFNRKAMFHCRAMVNCYMGDRRAEAPMHMAGFAGSQIIRSAESGPVGLELGAGVALPLGDGSSTIYADAAAEFNSGYNSANFTLGYRFSF